MAQESRIEVINKFGWRKDFVVDKPIIQIGRDARNDLVLDDGFERSAQFDFRIDAGLAGFVRQRRENFQ